MTYAYWQAALKGEKPKMYVDHPECGFYRMGVYEKQEGKARKRVGWTPVAIFHLGGELTAVIGTAREARTQSDRDRLNELWSYVAGNPISEATYRAVAERGEPWPDSHIASIPVANSSTLEETFTIQAQPQNVHERIAAELASLKAQLAAYANIESDEHCAKARSLQQKFLELRGEAAKHYEDANRPLLDMQKELRGVWFPIRDGADESSNALRKAMGAWEQSKRAAAREAEKRKSVDPSTTSNMPAPSAQIKGGVGRAASVRPWNQCIIDDEMKVFEFLKGSPDLSALLLKLAQKSTDAGISVPGTHTVEQVDVR